MRRLRGRCSAKLMVRLIAETAIDAAINACALFFFSAENDHDDRAIACLMRAVGKSAVVNRRTVIIGRI